MLKIAGNKKKKHNKIVMLARSKLNSIEKKIFEALINNEIGHEGFMIAINEERNYRELKESIRMMKSQRSNTEEVKKWGGGGGGCINEIIKQNEIINNSLKYQIENNVILLFKVQKKQKNIQKNINPMNFKN